MHFKHLFIVVCLLVLIASCKSTSAVATSKKNDDNTNFSKNTIRKTEKLIDDLITTAKENLGAKYKYAGTSKTGYDCSGLVYSVFKKFDILLPRNSFEQSKIGQPLQLQKEKPKKGDLIFFTTNNSKKINHVGIITSVKNEEEIDFIHSSTSKGVIISSTKEPYYKKTLLQINRVF